MGKLMHSTQIQHSSHPHLLHLSSNLHLQNQPPINCAGCNLHISATTDHHIYTCRPCNFFLHPSCSKFPELITHPSHPQHTLSLLPSCIYPGGFFRCDACTQQGNRFSYHCQICDFDLHVLCASKPLSVTNPSHPHPLHLTFSSPYGDKLGFSCDLCRNVGSGHQWHYRCVSCEFDAHLHCATAKPPPLQHHHSLPNQSAVTAPMAAQPLVHSMSTGHHVQGYWQQPQPTGPVGVQNYQRPSQPPPPPPAGVQSYQHPSQPPPPVGVQSYQGPSQPPPPPPVGVQSYQRPSQPPAPAPVGVQTYQVQPQPAMAAQNNGLANGLGNAMVTGFVEGMMQQLGQDLVQGLTDGGGGDGGGYGGDGGNINIEINTTNEDYDNY
ncbi:uncharacterized protein LOC112525214 [Cynara cardunculus var. scolymus]|uniref:C1-like protein n=1 Tax=Cynara cardunculus var. scolymus TaxID=59895 RepID=A0A103YA90_CYNCS|nr:uncharacterized protein LOC112525214 [Cynara cardunculus var. scolymus]KVI05390.1 C1-like protein [Cynara cardunculus var. scolymus]